MARCISCGAYFELPPVGHEDDRGESMLCLERCSGGDIEMEIARLDLEEADETFALDAAIPTLFAPDE